MTLLTQLEHRATEEWLHGVDSLSLVTLAQDRVQKLQSQSIAQPPTVLLAESDPTRFLAGFIAACTVNCPVFLCNPHWATSEWQQVLRLVQPEVVFGVLPDTPVRSSSHPPLPVPQPGWIMIPTGGSSGQVRFAIHTLQSLTAAVQGFQDFFEVQQINACCVLPLYHVSGLMQFLRSFLSGGRLTILPFKILENQCSGAVSLSAGVLQEFDPAHFFLSLVPTQLQRLLQAGADDWLQQFQTIFVGGAPTWTDLLTLARSEQLRLAPTYGMTETAAQVVTLKPDLFLQGQSGCGQVLPHASIKILDSATGLPSTTGQIGTIAIQAKSLMLGYFPDAIYPEEFPTDDLGCFNAQEILQVVGRNSQKIITGGENVFPAEVEAALRSTGLVRDVCVVGMPDQTWGEIVTAFYVPGLPEVTATTLKAALIPQLCHFKHPKQWIAVETLPRNTQGKINVEHLKQIL